MQVVMKIGSSAIEHCEPRQVRKEAAVSGKVYVPLECLVRANYMCSGHMLLSKKGVQPSNILYKTRSSLIGRVLLFYSLDLILITNFINISAGILLI